MIKFEFMLFSKKYSKENLLKNYTIDYLNDWLSHESELKYLFFLEDFNSKEVGQLEYKNFIFQTDLLNAEEKQFISSIYIDDAFVYSKNNEAYLNLTIKSEYIQQQPNEKIIKFLCNHIYNTTEFGFFKYGVIEPLTELQKKQLNWIDEYEWSYKLVKNDKYNLDQFDFLMLSNFTYLYDKNSVIQKLNQPVYISNFNIECYNIYKSIEQLDNDIYRYKKSIKFLKKKRQELKNIKKELQANYKRTYINMLSNPNKIWHEKQI